MTHFQHSPFVFAEFALDAGTRRLERGRDARDIAGFEAAENGDSIRFQDSNLVLR